MARMMAVRRQMRMRRRRRRRMLLLVGGMAVLGYAGYKMSQKDVQRVEEQTGQKADELTDEQLEQAMDQLGIEKETMSDEEWAEAQKADAQPSYLDELERLGELHKQGILTDEEFEAKKKKLLDL
jgi:RES domain-containing protein